MNYVDITGTCFGLDLQCALSSHGWKLVSGGAGTVRDRAMVSVKQVTYHAL